MEGTATTVGIQLKSRAKIDHGFAELLAFLPKIIAEGSRPVQGWRIGGTTEGLS